VLASDGTRQTIGRIEVGGTFGEMALMTGDTIERTQGPYRDAERRAAQLV
jgi:CRP-like cAMP-binding protein